RLRAGGTGSTRGSLRRVGLVKDLGQFVAGVGQLLVRGLQLSRRRCAFERLLGLGQCGFDLGLVGSLHLFAGIFQHLLDVVDQRVEAVAGFNLFALFLVLG